MVRSALAHEVQHRATRRPLSVDAHVGDKLRTRRVLAGMSQTELGKTVGITFQQVQKYEKAVNRVSAGTSMRSPRFLRVRPTTF